MDPVTAIAQGVGSIFNFGSSLVGAKAQSSHDKYAMQLEAMEMAQDRQMYTWMAILAAVAVVGIILWKKL